MFTFVGYQMKDINSLFQGKHFSEKTTAEKVQQVLTYVMLLFTFGLMVIFAVVAKKKYTEFETQHRLQAALVKSQMIEMERRQPHERYPDQQDP